MTFATLGPDGLTANIKLLPDEQALKCLVAAEAFSAIPNGWGRMGWTTATLSALTVAELEDVLRIAWQHASQKPAKTSRKR